MEGVLKASSIPFPSIRQRQLIFASKCCTRLHIPSSCIVPGSSKRRLQISSAITGPVTAITRGEEEEEEEREKFAWYEEWYPVAPVCDLDKKRVHGKKVMGLEVVVWWDRNEEAWKVFDDNCPHRLAPLSEGRIDGKGRLQCVYHGWCFGGGGDCKYIPQAPRDGPPVHSSSKACVGVYPSCVQNGIVWFWPNIIATMDDDEKLKKKRKKPPYIPELDDPSYSNGMSSREAPYPYEILVENLVDPAHVPYAHHRILRIFDKPTNTASIHDRDRDKEGGGPLRIDVGRINASGFTAKLGDTTTTSYSFKAPCLYSASYYLDDERKMKAVLVFLCVPVSAGNSRLIFAFPRNFGVWMDRVIPRWVYHIGENMVFDSDLHLLMVEEKRLKAVGSLNWNKTCYVPTKADAMVVSFRRWLNTYAGTRVDFKRKDDDDDDDNENASLLLPYNREQLFDRYWSHTVKCSSCSLAYKCLTALHLALQLVSVASVAIAAVAAPPPEYKHIISMVAVLCFAASKWLSHFVYKTFRYHDYDHAFH